MKFDSDPNYAIVSGTSTGLGEAVARQLLEHGWLVIGIARRPAPFVHDRYRHVAYDLAGVADDPAALESQLALPDVRAASRMGLVNNAAVPEGLMPLARLDPRELARIYAVNLIAPLWLMGYLIRTAQPDTPLRIVNVSSGAATTGFAGLAAYGSSKAALRLAGMSLAREWDTPSPTARPRDDAAILSYEPGVVDTDMQRYARSRPADEFPWAQMFHDFAARGVAVPPERPARDIVAFLESDNEPPFAERRLRP
ncbi:MAG TPA: SDR family NAD(P)-dependent oxidoreductase [Gemmatimonadaceae bacterium]|nr:SDR family NAD(P)-dependent oxidoreductase [Gemmatimonadaceae bacterium]